MFKRERDIFRQVGKLLFKRASHSGNG
jgi:hypothetical protein